MKIRLIIGQYPGELMPNVLAAWDEFALEDNPEGYRSELSTYERGVTNGDLEGVREATVTVYDYEVRALFDAPTLTRARFE